MKCHTDGKYVNKKVMRMIAETKRKFLTDAKEVP